MIKTFGNYIESHKPSTTKFLLVGIRALMFAIKEWLFFVLYTTIISNSTKTSGDIPKYYEDY